MSDEVLDLANELASAMNAGSRPSERGRRLKKVTVLDGHYASGVYQHSLLPRGANYGRWRITVEFEALPTEAVPRRLTPESDVAPLCNSCFQPANAHAHDCARSPTKDAKRPTPNNCPGLNADGTCPFGFGRTCCAALSSEDAKRPTPTLPLFDSGKSDLSAEADAHFSSGQDATRPTGDKE